MLRKIVLVINLLVFACATRYTPKMVQHIKGSIFKATDHGYYTAEMVMKPSRPRVGTNMARLIIHDYEGRDIPGLRIKVLPVLPSKNLISPRKPVVEDAGQGLYIIKNIYLPKPGRWKLRIKIYGEMVDTVILPLPEVTK